MLSNRYLVSMVKKRVIFCEKSIKILLLIFTGFSTIVSSTIISVDTTEFNGKNQAQLRASSIQYKKSTQALQARIAELENRAADGVTTISISEITSDLLKRVYESLI